MLAEAVDELPSGKGWRFEPKWDGFRCLVHRDGPGVALMSKNQKPLQRYFPELVEAFAALPAELVVIDGEILSDSFEQLQLRTHPAASRIAKLAREQPARFVAFDLPVAPGGRDIRKARLVDRRAALEDLLKPVRSRLPIEISKSTASRATALRWLERGIEGIMAKRDDEPYRAGERGWLKYKVWKTVDCVVGGLYWANNRPGIVESLLMGLYDTDGKLHYVGKARVGGHGAGLAPLLKPLIGGKGFTGRAPQGKNRWSGREHTAIPLKPKLVAEVSADHITARFFRHGARIIRWRDDKDPEDCTMDQIEPAASR